LATRRHTKKVMVGGIPIGGDSPITIQSMTNTDTCDVSATVDQIKRIVKAGGELVRVAVPDDDAVQALGEITSKSPVPVVADIHYRHDLAIMAMEKGASKVRINPGNLGGTEKYLKVLDKAREYKIPLRIGVNAGSMEKEIKERYGEVNAEAMVDSALGYLRTAEEANFRDLVISLKASRVPETIEAYRIMSEKVPYPLHVGVTEAGSLYRGSIKSAVGIGTLLAKGIGDTMRVSLSSSPEKEVEAGKLILQALDVRVFGPDIISCPTCARSEIDVEKLSHQVEGLLEGSSRPLRVAVMGCVVNGPGEAGDSDLGVTGTRRFGIIFRDGKVVKKVEREQLLEALKEEIDSSPQ